MIANELERDCFEILEVQASVTIGFFTFRKQAKRQNMQDMADSILKITYPYISEGKNWTDSRLEHFQVRCSIWLYSSFLAQLFLHEIYFLKSSATNAFLSFQVLLLAKEAE